MYDKIRYFILNHLNWVWMFCYICAYPLFCLLALNHSKNIEEFACEVHYLMFVTLKRRYKMFNILYEWLMNTPTKNIKVIEWRKEKIECEAD